MSEESTTTISQDRIRYMTTHSGWSVASTRAIFARLVHDDAAQDLAEYGIALAVIGTVAGAVAVVVAGDVGTLWSNAQSLINFSVSP